MVWRISRENNQCMSTVLRLKDTNCSGKSQLTMWNTVFQKASFSTGSSNDDGFQSKYEDDPHVVLIGANLSPRLVECGAKS